MRDVRAKTLAALIAVTTVACPVAFAGAPADTVDASVRPGDDFYRFASGPWLDATKIPDGRASYDSSAMLRDENARRVRDLIQGAANTAAATGLSQKVGDYYASQMDAAGIEAKGLAPLAGELAAIAGIADRTALSAYLGHTLRSDDGTDTQVDGIFGVWIHQGFVEAEHYLPHLVQGGLGLGEREAYLDPAPEKAMRRDAYRTHIAKIFSLAGVDQADVRAARVLSLEIAIARTHASRADTDDPVKDNNTWQRANFDAHAAGMDWNAYFEAAGLGHQAQFVVWQPSAVTGTSALIASVPLDAWKDYLAFHLIEHNVAVLPKAFNEEHFAFLGEPVPDRGERSIAATNAALGEAVGRLYVARYFPPAAKAAARAMVENIRIAFRARIAALPWMSPETKQKALAKLAALKVGVGYPDTWTDYEGLSIVRGDAYGNLGRAEAFAYRRDLAKLTQPVDPAEWALLPQTVGAVINFSPNSMQFSAGILQPPYFDPAGDAASNYGSAGAGLAHEVSHSFDTLGNVYDAQGNMNGWWTANDLARYSAATAPLAAQYDAYCPRPDLCVKGKQVLGEAVADLAGLRAAHDAYLLSLHGKADAIKNGLTGEQRFFLAFARRWRRVQSDEALRRQIAGDTHPPGEYRSDTVRNLDAWYGAFGIGPGDKLYLKPAARIGIW